MRWLSRRAPVRRCCRRPRRPACATPTRRSGRLRLDALRLANRADQFDEAAIDYCVTYEVSPPSWERTRCNVRISGSGMNTHTPPLSMVSEVSTGFLESGLVDDAGSGTQVASIELSGQLVGDISADA